MNTAEFICRKKLMHLDTQDYYCWAEHLVRKGYESESVIELLACPDMHWQDLNRCVSRIFDELKIEPETAVPRQDLFRIKENILLHDYLAGKMNAETLISRGCDLCSASGHTDEFNIWYELDCDQACLLSQDVTPHYLKVKNIDESLCLALTTAGKLPIKEVISSLP